ncbi:MAG: phosphatidylserine/phosphatidylglycerophosphate/cardiolipin synthase family protein [Deltaproteobacteria bacterium]|nr:phosphatidylserine/phosphatidylglycerophosphate/cardiolipin synthase family protein [Deltaproteobacteria bacterium]
MVERAKTNQLPVRILENGRQAFDRILEHINQAKHSIDMQCFVWRDDKTGNLMARRILDAADRGVQVTIRKDRVGAVYEHFDPNGYSFFHKRLRPVERFNVEFLLFAYRRGRTVKKQYPNPLAQRMVDHPNITLHIDRQLFDHSKFFIFDDTTMIIGGMGIGDDFRSKWMDLMVELPGAEHIHRFESHRTDPRPPSDHRPIDFVVNAVLPDGTKRFDVLRRRQEQFARTRKSLVIEMAYLGDPRMTDILVALLRRGVQITVLLSTHANILHDQNIWVLDELYRRSGAPDRLEVYLYPNMVHTKLLIWDETVAQIGSSNLTRLSHHGYEETDLWITDQATVSRLSALIIEHKKTCVQVSYPIAYSPFNCLVERILQFRHSNTPMDHRPSEAPQALDVQAPSETNQESQTPTF